MLPFSNKYKVEREAQGLLQNELEIDSWLFLNYELKQQDEACTSTYFLGQTLQYLHPILEKGVFRLVFDSFCWVEARLEPIIAVSD